MYLIYKGILPDTALPVCGYNLLNNRLNGGTQTSPTPWFPNTAAFLTAVSSDMIGCA